MSKLIVLEGIDGSGKTSITKRIKEIMEAEGCSVFCVSKKNPIISDKEMKSYVDMLKSIIWHAKADGIPWEFLDGTQWILQVALWYSVLNKQYIKELEKEYDYLLIDGWFYKLYARSQFNQNVHKSLIEELLAFLKIDGNIFLLKNDPRECWKRRPEFKRTEIAPYGDLIQDPYSSYVDFQEKVQNRMLEMADQEKWNIIECYQKSIEELAFEIRKHIH